ncbi:hypothetical protein HZS_3609 [Henneguya salminicola]|nr:hypothetical protein HZS_3609 [Henneguya salminicola]
MTEDFDVLKILAQEMGKEIKGEKKACQEFETKNTSGTASSPLNFCNTSPKEFITFEKNSKLRIRDQKISDSELNLQIKNAEIVSICSLSSTESKNKLTRKAQMRICIPGVICRKSSHVSKACKTYTRMELSSLQPTLENFTICCFLFGVCQNFYGKTEVGTLIYIFDPKIDDNDKQHIKIFPNLADSIIIIGEAVDFGICKGIVAKTSKSCTLIVNKQHGDFCQYHVSKELHKQKSGRSELKTHYDKPLLRLSFGQNSNQLSQFSQLFPHSPNVQSECDNKSLKDFGTPTKSLNDYIQESSPGSRNLLKHISIQKDEKCKKKAAKKYKVSDFLVSNFVAPKRRFSENFVKSVLEKTNFSYNFAIADNSSTSKEVLNLSDSSNKHESIHQDVNEICVLQQNIKPLRKCQSSIIKEKENELKNNYSLPHINQEKSDDTLDPITDHGGTLMCCKTCKYKGEKILPQCLENNHVIIKLKSTKQIFKRLNCKSDTISSKSIRTTPSKYIH